ncbi:hypothetical protein C8R46DRAFT_1162644 [Mycena filopes]|nr:hypothetical protein C8R46DRAFT_1162644 [Mycena filopes]
MSSILEPRRRQQPFLLLQSSAAQSGIGIIRQLLEDASEHAVLFCLLHSALLSTWTACPNARFVGQPSTGPLDFIVDSVDTLASDIGSISETYKFLWDLMSLIRARSSPSRLILHALSPSPLISLLTQPGFSSSLTQVIAHPPALLLHLSTEYLTPPPPLSSEAKFWAIFLPVSERVHESERLIFGTDGDGTGDAEELVIEVIVRGDAEGSRRRGVGRTLEGWSLTRGPCPLADIAALKSIVVADPTQDVSFNLNLTEAPAKFPSPRKPMAKPTPGTISYDPDSADDIDDDDPDEDLDI